MQIEVIEFEFGMTQNLGDYTNVRPSLKLVARLVEGDDYNEAIGELTRQAIDNVHDIVDDELEQAGRQIKYSFVQLYQVRRSDIRKCTVLFPANTTLPDERTWRDKDYWSRPSVDRDHPDRMRIQLAQVVAMTDAETSGCELFFCTDGNLTVIPPLPDPGPEPLWHQKGLEQDFKAMRIGAELWEELAGLDWVTSSYTSELRRQNWGVSADEIVAQIRGNTPLPIEAEEDEEEEEDYDEDED